MPRGRRYGRRSYRRRHMVRRGRRRYGARGSRRGLRLRVGRRM